MNEITIFSNPQFGEIRTAGTSDEPLFCLADVCKVLELRTDKVASRLNRDNLSKVSLQTTGGKQELNFINEDGLYDAVLDSRKPTARKFRKWVTSEVLPAIRKKGGYMVSKENETPEELMARALIIAQDALTKKEERIKTLQEDNKLKDKQITFMQTENETLKARQTYMDVVLSCKSTLLTTSIAQDYGMTAMAFNKVLRDLNIQHKVNGQWILYGKYLPMGYVQSETIQITRSNGRPDVVMNTRWTQKGRAFLYEKLKKNGMVPLIERQVD